VKYFHARHGVLALRDFLIPATVHIMEVLPTFSRVVSNYIELLERI
jgi:hypothetical protein